MLTFHCLQTTPLYTYADNKMAVSNNSVVFFNNRVYHMSSEGRMGGWEGRRGREERWIGGKDQDGRGRRGVLLVAISFSGNIPYLMPSLSSCPDDL